MGIFEKVESNVETFVHVGEGEAIHIIKTGFDDTYIVVWEDACEQVLGVTEIKTKKEIEDKFKIKLSA